MRKGLALFSYSDEAMAAMIENPADREAAVEASDSVTMAGISTAIRSTGTIRSETFDLFASDDIHHILDTARTARASFTEPGR